MTAEGIAIANLLAAEKRIAELEALCKECTDYLTTFGSSGAHKNSYLSSHLQFKLSEQASK